ncbi:hypothetical protein K438DRAFT_2025099 [Mycena galopus ATCC 62051]|nr:hypothetical protein K438DRAFT_2025099 [Mycena galopus ATCC 62051]
MKYNLCSHKVPMASVSSTDSSSTDGSPVEMDARGTSTDNGESSSPLPALTASVIENMSHSTKSHSNIQDVAETEHRPASGILDTTSVSGSHDANTSMSDAPVAPVTPMHTQGNSAILDTPVKKGLDDNGFTTPKRTSPTHSARSLSPVLVSEPRYFDGRYLLEDDVKDVRPEEDGQSPLISWADSTHDDGLGNIPPSWMKQESVSVDLHWSPGTDDNVNFSSETILKEIDDNLTLGQKETLLRREAKMKTVNVKHARSTSTTTAHESEVNTPSIKVTPLNNDATGNSPSGIAHSTPRIPADAKGKERDFADGLSIYSDDDYVSDGEADAKARTEYQIQVDALLAMCLQKALDDHNSGQREVKFTPTSPTVRLPKQSMPAPVAGTSAAPPLPAYAPSAAPVHAHAPASNPATADDYGIAKCLQDMFDVQYARLAALGHGREADLAGPEKFPHPEEFTVHPAPQARPTPMEQVPKDSVLFQEVNAKANTSGQSRKRKVKGNSAPPPDDGGDSSSSSDEGESGDPKLPAFLTKKGKLKKKKSSKPKKDSGGGGGGNPPAPPPGGDLSPSSSDS